MRETCTVDGCEKPRVGRGLCSMHYSRLQRGQELGGAEHRKRGKPLTHCTICGEPCVGQGLCETHYDEMIRRPRKKDARLTSKDGRSCLECGGPIPPEHRADSFFCSTKCKQDRHNAVAAERPGHAERLRQYHYKSKYGLPIEEFDRLLAEQDGRCAICGTDESGGRGRFHVDHCHESGKVRGLLCVGCNIGLGQFQDDPARLLAAVKYLESHPA